jgi:hypothetical protein
MTGKGNWRQNPATGVVLLLLIVGAVVFTIWHRMSSRTQLGETLTIIAYCEETGRVRELKIETKAKPPYFCPESGGNTAYVALQCGQCGSYYGMKTTPAIENACPRCGAKMARLATYAPDKSGKE